jgi:hypothetical protein
MARFRITGLQRAAIHLPDAAPPALRFAAQELQRYLERMSGVRLRVVPDVSADSRSVMTVGTGPPMTVPAPPMNAPGSFTVVPEPARITLEASSPQSLLHATYRLLEELGCRWSLHGAADEIVPRLPEEVDLAPVRHAPPFTVRGYCTDIMTWHYTQPDHFESRLADDRSFIDWMGKSGANAFFFIRHPFDTQLTIPELLPDFQRRGIDVEYGGHVIPLLLPRALYADHPDYFPQSPDGTRTDLGNLCTSNPAALAAASANAVQYVREYGEASALHIWGADLWHGGWCACSACAVSSVQDQSLRTCNAVARGLAEAGCGRPVCYLAYHDTIEPQLTLRPDPNVVAEFAPRERCYGHALNDPECATNRRYARALERYVEIFDGRVRLFEYYGDAILFFGCAVPLTQVIRDDLDYYKQLGITAITMLQFGTFSLWAYPLNFLAFATATTAPAAAQSASEQYCARLGTRAGEATAKWTELEAIMRQVVTYGDVRRPPRSAAAAAQLLSRVESALPHLLNVAQRFEELGDAALEAQAVLLRYTHAVLDGVQQQLRSTIAGASGPGDARYAQALQIIEAVDRRFKGLWGTIDLPIIHGYYSAVAEHSDT